VFSRCQLVTLYKTNSYHCHLKISTLYFLFLFAMAKLLYNFQRYKFQINPLNHFFVFFLMFHVFPYIHIFLRNFYLLLTQGDFHGFYIFHNYILSSFLLENYRYHVLFLSFYNTVPYKHSSAGSLTDILLFLTLVKFPVFPNLPSPFSNLSHIIP